MSYGDGLESNNRKSGSSSPILQLLCVVDFEVFRMLLSLSKGQIQQVWVQGSDISR